jgi:HEAT repeat protein
VEALADDEEARPMIAALLDHARANIVCSAIRALQTGTDSYPRFVALLHHDHSAVRCAAIDALRDSIPDWPHLHRFLDSEEPDERAAAITALRSDGSVRDRIFGMLSQDAFHVVRHAAIGVLGASSIEIAALRQYFEDTRSREEHETIGPKHEYLAHGYLRAQILEKLAARTTEREHAKILEALSDPRDEVRLAAVKAVPITPETRGVVAPLIRDRDLSVREAAYEALAEDPEICQKIIAMLDEDLWAVRIAAFHALMPYEAEREKLLARFADKNGSESERATMIEPLLRDPEKALPYLRKCIDFDAVGKVSEVSSAALGLLEHDGEVRRILREYARDPKWVRNLSFPMNSRVATILASDPEAYPILEVHLSSTDESILEEVAPMLAEHPPAWPHIRKLLDHSRQRLKWAALRALGKDEVSRPRLLQALADKDRLIRQEAAKGLRHAPEARPHFLPLLADDDDSIRGIALDVLTDNPTPEEQTALRERLTVEPKEELRLRILYALASDPIAKPLLQDRLHHDPVSAIRTTAARALGGGDESNLISLAELPSIQRVLTLLRFENLSPTDARHANRLNAFVADPHPKDLDEDPDFGELVLAWACLRLTWASADGALTPTQGRILGETETPRSRLSAKGPALVIRVAMDAAELPRERHFFPNHNTIEARSVVLYLSAAEPPAIILACADTALKHLPAPPIDPGEAHFGPTFFGFRIGTPASPASPLTPQGERIKAGG